MRGVEVPGFTKANFHDIQNRLSIWARRKVGKPQACQSLFWFNHYELGQDCQRPI